MSSNMEPEIHEAVRNKDITTVEKLLSERIDVNTISNDRSPLDLALDLKFHKIALLLLDCGGKLNASTHVRSFALHVAASASDELEVESLLENGFDVHQVKKIIGYTALHLSRTSKVTEILLANGLEIDAINVRGQTSIYVAISRGYVDTVRCLASHGADVNIADMHGNTPLHAAAGKSGMSEVIEILLANGAEINEEGQYGRAPIHAAVECGLVDNVRCLADHGADLHIEDESEGTPLHVAAGRLESSEVIEILLANGARINEKDPMLRTPIYIAVQCGSVSNVKCLARHGADVNILDMNGLTPLHRAAERLESSEVIEILLANGARINARDQLGHTPIHAAASEGRLDNVRCLAGHGADVDLTNSTRNSPLHAAARQSGMVEVFKILLARGAKINAKDSDGQTPIYIAVKYGSVDDVRCLIGHGADVNSSDFHRITPLHEAVKHRSSCPLMVETLLANGADVNALTTYGHNPLHCLERSSSDRTRMVGEILKHDVDINAQDIYGQTPLHFAVHCAEIVRMYLKRGADINIESEWRETPLELAQRCILEFEPTGDNDRLNNNLQLTAEYLMQHIIESRVAGLYVSRNNIEMAYSLMGHHNDETNRATHGRHDEYYQKCGLESHKFKSNVGIVLRDILMTKYPSYLSNTELWDRLKTINNNNSDYPIYGDLILDKFERDKKRYMLLERCKSLFTRSELEPALPEEIWEKILSNLGDASLRRVVDSIKWLTGLGLMH